jgi:hypothetical protein
MSTESAIPSRQERSTTNTEEAKHDIVTQLAKLPEHLLSSLKAGDSVYWIRLLDHYGDAYKVSVVALLPSRNRLGVRAIVKEHDAAAAKLHGQTHEVYVIDLFVDKSTAYRAIRDRISRRNQRLRKLKSSAQQSRRPA